VKAHLQAALVLGAKPVLHLPGPDPPGGAELGDLLKKVYVRVKEKREARREVVHVEARLYPRLHVRKAVGQGKGELLGGGAPRLADVVARNGDGIPPGHVLCGVDQHVLKDPHGGFDREDPLFLGYVLL
jgi:hypothetical protein